MCKYLVLSSIFLSSSVLAVTCDEPDNDNKYKCVWNDDTGTVFRFSYSPIYTNDYDISLIPLKKSAGNDANCDSGTVTLKILPKYSYFKENHDFDSQNNVEMVVDVYQVTLTDDNNLLSDAKLARDDFFSTPYKVCKKGMHAVSKAYYKRVGGLNTGLLVVPFKLRDKDIFSDTTVGPYLSYKFQRLEILTSLGLTQIAVSEVDTTEVESKTGLSFAIGISFEVQKSWDVAFLAGVDHLSGSDGDVWQYQDDLWLSFGIGYNFTR